MGIKLLICYQLIYGYDLQMKENYAHQNKYYKKINYNRAEDQNRYLSIHKDSLPLRYETFHKYFVNF